MTQGMLGKKLGMTRIFLEDGRWIPVTVLEVGPCPVVQRRTTENDGYEAVQIGLGSRKEKHTTKAMQGHFKSAAVEPLRVLREFPVDASSELKVGDSITSDLFKTGDRVDVTGTSKGKGFAGVMKRYGYGGGPGGHGSNFKRAPGAIGACADPSKVFKGKGLPGHMGSVRRTVQNLEVVEVDHEKNVVLVRGAVPGANGGFVRVKHSVKRKKGAA